MKILRHLKIKCFLFTVICSSYLQGQSISVSTFSGGYTKPVAIKNAGDGRLFIVEQGGKIMICDSLGVKNPVPFLDISHLTKEQGERGLLGLAFHPNYTDNGFFYINYTSSVNDYATTISRYRVSSNANIADTNSASIVLTVDQPFANHNGGDLHFGPDGYLYIGMGDGGSFGDPDNRSQNKQSLLGKMLRVDINVMGGYGIPPTNPFVGDPSTLDEIWALGYRNPWRFSFDRLTGDMWIADVGQDRWEEVNFEHANSDGGNNYGWRCYEGNARYNTEGCAPMTNYTFPIVTYRQAQGVGCSITGGYRYRGGKYGDLFGVYFHTDFCTGNVWATQGSPGNWSTELLADLNNFEFASLGEDQFGELYFTGRMTGNIYALQDTSCNPTAYITEGDSISISPGTAIHAIDGAGNSYQWFRNDTLIQGAMDANYQPTKSAEYSVEVTNSSGCSNTSLAIWVTVLENGIRLKSDNDDASSSDGNAFDLFPNPTADAFVVAFKEVVDGLYSINVLNSLGQNVYHVQSSEQKINISTNNWRKGVYFVRIRNSSGVNTVRLIKQ